jgi:transcriptional regulator with XRE-family HTH domain
MTVRHIPNSGWNGRLKIIRDERNLSQQAFADLCGISVRAYRNYELGMREPPIGTF